MHDIPEALCQDMFKFSPLSRQEEKALAIRIKEGDVEARNELALSNMRFGAWMANRWHNPLDHIPYSEFLSAASYALLKSASRFDPNRKVKFISYAVSWIRFYFLKLINEFGGSIRVSENQRRNLRKIQKALATEDTNALHGLDMSEDDIKSILSRRITEMPLVQVAEVESYDDEQNECSVVRLDETIPYENEPLPDDDLFYGERIDIIEKLLGRINPRDRFIIELYYDFFGRGPKTLKQIGEIMGVTSERIRELRNRGLEHLGQIKRRHLLD